MQGAGLGRAAGLPVLRRPPRSERPHLPARQRVQALIPPEVLARAPLQVLGRLVDASNSTLLARLGDPAAGPLVVYKPIAGERPLWDFADGSLAARERAAYLVSEAGGWRLVPRTILRDGPAGHGMVQEWIGDLEHEADLVVRVLTPTSDDHGLIRVMRAEGARGEPLFVAHEDAADVEGMAVLDAVLNNTDRKGAHAFRHEGRLVGVDHGLTFHVEDKLRTVLWGWAGDRLKPQDVARLERVRDALAPEGALTLALTELLGAPEIDALAARVGRLLARGRHPRPAPGWPSIPWPPI